jgi:glycosyltransferase involved in cell wall biosynthesis
MFGGLLQRFGKRPAPERGERAKILIASCVGGGPMERLARTLSRRGLTTGVIDAFSPQLWRRLMSSGAFGRLRARLDAMVLFPLQMVVRGRQQRPTFLVPTTNPFFLPFIAILTRPLHGSRVVPLVYDLYPDAAQAAGLSSGRGLFARVTALANRYWFARADAVVFIGATMAQHARSRYGEPRRWEIIETGADADELQPVVSAEAASPGERATLANTWDPRRLVISYVGNMGATHDWRTLAGAIPQILESDGQRAIAETWRSPQFVIAASGPGAERIKQASAEFSPADVLFLDPLSDRRWAQLLLDSAINIVTLRPEAAHASVPSKLFSGMAAGAAIIAVAPEHSDLAELVRRHRCGVVVAPGDVAALVESVQRYRRDPQTLVADRRRARKALLDHFDLYRLAQRWEDLLASI